MRGFEWLEIDMTNEWVDEMAKNVLLNGFITAMRECSNYHMRLFLEHGLGFGYNIPVGC